MKKKQIQMHALFQYRNVWMGMAILWVILYHSNFVFDGNMFGIIKSFGIAGVDIFLFASGLGCYYSLDKDSDMVSFLRRRFWKIMPAYWCFITIWLIARAYAYGMSFQAAIGNFFCVQGFINFENSFNWYMGAIWIFYFMAPFFKYMADKADSDWKMIGFTVLLLAISTAFWNVETLIIIATRVPIFFVGMYFGKLGKSGRQLSTLMVVMSILGVILGSKLYQYFLLHYSNDDMWGKGLYWYPFLLIVPGFCILTSLFFYFCKLKPVEKVLAFIGDISFEVYLLHIFIFRIYYNFVNRGYVNGSNRNLLLVICFVFLCSFLFKKAIERVLKFIKR